MASNQAPQPIVLVGGKSTRFGCDKLRAALADGWLVDRPIAALRAVFGPRVALVGEADPEVLARGDATIVDRHPGIGPLGGIISALEAAGDVFVLPGDAPAIDAAAIRAILARAGESPEAWAVLADSGRLEPCVGLYRRAALPALHAHRARPEAPLGAAIPAQQLARVAVDVRRLANVNTPDDLAALGLDREEGGDR